MPSLKPEDGGQIQTYIQRVDAKTENCSYVNFQQNIVEWWISWPSALLWLRMFVSPYRSDGPDRSPILRRDRVNGSHLDAACRVVVLSLCLHPIKSWNKPQL